MNCRNCGTELPTGALFCGECGTTVAVPRLVEPHTRPRPGDTAIIQPIDIRAPKLEFLEPDPVEPDPVEPAADAQIETSPAAAPVEPAAPATTPRPEAPSRSHPRPRVPDPWPQAELAPAPAPALAPTPAPAATAVTPPLTRAPIGRPASVTPPVTSAPITPPASVAQASVTPTGRALDSTLEAQHNDVEATRIVRGRQGDRFVLQFSTGENATVFGTGLIGRNPVLQPGEFVDQLVTIVDQGKSVSKTHLEFGQTSGVFWVVDRFSANGTVVRQPDAPPQRLDPGKRQPVARGTRVDVGEQFFVVS